MGKTAFSPIVPRSILAFMVLLVLAAMPRVAAADEQAAVNKVTNLNRKGIEAYNKQDYEAARALLKEALEVCAASGLDKHPIRARTHIHFGIVAIVGFKQREVGLKQFRKALEVQPDIKLTKQLITPELQDAFEEAVLAGEGGGGGGTAAAGGGEPSVDADGPRADAEGGDEDGSRPPARKPLPRKKKPGDDDDDKEEDEGAQTGSFFIALAGGTGFGIASGSGELDPAAHKLDSAGFAMAQLAHVAPEVGFFISPDLLISAQLRLQYVNGLNGKPGMGCGTDMFCTPGNGALAGFVKVTYLMGTSPFRLTVGGQVGGGNIRHAVTFPDNTCRASAAPVSDMNMNQPCVDTLPGGPFLVGPTFGFIYELGSSVGLVAGINSALGVPNFTFNLDINAGIAFRI
jgi:hypothetical protein